MIVLPVKIHESVDYTLVKGSRYMASPDGCDTVTITNCVFSMRSKIVKCLPPQWYSSWL